MNNKDSKIKSFTDLKAWQEGHRLVVSIYKITENFPRKEIYSLTDQIRRASVSVTSNIAEGFGRRSFKEKVQFYYQAQGSLTELKNQILIARDVHYSSRTELLRLSEQANTVHRLLQGLIKKTKTFLNPKS